MISCGNNASRTSSPIKIPWSSTAPVILWQQSYAVALAGCIGGACGGSAGLRLQGRAESFSSYESLLKLKRAIRAIEVGQR